MEEPQCPCGSLSGDDGGRDGLGLAGLPLPYAEAANLASVIVFGLLALVSRRLPTMLLAGLIGAFVPQLRSRHRDAGDGLHALPAH